MLIMSIDFQYDMRALIIYSLLEAQRNDWYVSVVWFNLDNALA